MPVLTVGDLRRLVLDPDLPDSMPVVSWSSDLTGRIEGVLAVGVVQEERRVAGGLFIGEDAIASNLDEPTFVRRLWGGEDDEAR